jgi:Predicted transcriptional regulator
MASAGTTAAKKPITSSSKSEENYENEILDKFDENSIVIVPVNDESKKLRQILSNETSMRILELLKQESLSASAVAEKLDLPLTTVKYNIDQLVEYDLAYIQRVKYSEKGRQVKIYEAQEKVIIFAPEKVSRVSLTAMLQKYAFAFLVAAFAGFGLNYIYQQHLNKTFMERNDLEHTAFLGMVNDTDTGAALGEADLPIADNATSVSESASSAAEAFIDTAGEPSFFHNIIISINDWFFGLLTHHAFWFIAGALFVCVVIWTIEYLSVKKETASAKTDSVNE